MDKILMADYSESLPRESKKSKLYTELYEKPLKELIEEFDKVDTQPGGAITDYPRYEVLKGVIADKLSLPTRDILLVTLNESLKEVHEMIADLDDEFKNHRHNLDKTYGEKPIW